MKIYFKIAVCAVSGFALLVTGYCFGLVVQKKSDDRFAAVWELAGAIRLHKTLLVGNYDEAQHLVMCQMVHGEEHVDDGLEFGKWRVLFHESLDGVYDKEFHRAALAHIIGMRRVEPNIVYPIELQPELDAFVPRTEGEQHCLDSYAKLDPWDTAGR